MFACLTFCLSFSLSSLSVGLSPSVSLCLHCWVCCCVVYSQEVDRGRAERPDRPRPPSHWAAAASGGGADGSGVAASGEGSVPADVRGWQAGHCESGRWGRASAGGVHDGEGKMGESQSSVEPVICAGERVGTVCTSGRMWGWPRRKWLMGLSTFQDRVSLFSDLSDLSEKGTWSMLCLMAKEEDFSWPSTLNAFPSPIFLPDKGLFCLWSVLPHKQFSHSKCPNQIESVYRIAKGFPHPLFILLKELLFTGVLLAKSVLPWRWRLGGMFPQKFNFVNPRNQFGGAIWSQNKQTFWQDCWRYLHVFYVEQTQVSLKRDIISCGSTWLTTLSSKILKQRES